VDHIAVGLDGGFQKSIDVTGEKTEKCASSSEKEGTL
jgi:hypothetical protein